MLQVEQVPTSALKPWDDNPRVNDVAVAAVVRSIQSFGFNVPILCDANRTIIAGHTRWRAAMRMGMDTVPVITLHLTDTQRRAFAIADNRTAEIAEWDLPKLCEVLTELRGVEVDLTDLGFSDEELRRLLKTPSADEDGLPDLAVDRETTAGDLWVLGDHRVLCGDSRDSASIDLLTEGKAMDHVFGGPPYFNQREYSHWDNYDGYLNDMVSVMQNCRERMKDGAVLVWNIGSGSSTGHDHASNHSSLLARVGLGYLDTIIWVKSGANFSIPRNCHIRRNRCYYPAFQWEALLVFHKQGKMPRMSREGVEYMSACQTNVWQIPPVTRQRQDHGHPAVCPVEIPYRCLQAYTVRGDSVLDPFGGSGSTLIAAEQAGRRAFLLERVPEYCSLIVQRWEMLTGRKGKLIKSVGAETVV